jgi:hypothetical protein
MYKESVICVLIIEAPFLEISWVVSRSQRKGGLLGARISAEPAGRDSAPPHRR